MQQHFCAVLKRLFPSGDKVLVAVSGGVDSMCMAELFLSSGLPFEVAHCNFSLRGEESDGDQSLVESWCLEHGVQLNTVRFDTSAYAAGHGISVEMAARELRYTWFSEICSRRGCRAVAVAHNANDNAETLVLNLLRGTGLRGLCGMKVDGLLPIPGTSVRLVRPMLGFTRKEIEAFALSTGLTYRTDSSNVDNAYKRNKVRNEIFPLFADINPSFLQTLGVDMGHFAEVHAILDDWLEDWRPLVVVSEKPFVVDIGALMGCKHWKWLLYRLLEPYEFNAATLESLGSLLSNYRNTEIPVTFSGKRFLGDGYELFTTGERIIVTPIGERKVPPSVLVEGPGVCRLGDRCFELSLSPWPAEGLLPTQPEGVLIMDAAQLSFPLLLRGWLDGDWFVPLGMHGRKKLSDFFVDHKYTLADKARAVVAVAGSYPTAESGSRIAALLCVRPDDGIKVGPSTKSVLIIKEI